MKPWASRWRPGPTGPGPCSSRLTYGSRALALVFMPDPPVRVKAVLDRIPAPLFAALAVTALIHERKLADPATLTAALFGLALAPTRSLLWVRTLPRDRGGGRAGLDPDTRPAQRAYPPAEPH